MTAICNGITSAHPNKWSAVFPTCQLSRTYPTLFWSASSLCSYFIDSSSVFMRQRNVAAMEFVNLGRSKSIVNENYVIATMERQTWNASDIAHELGVSQIRLNETLVDNCTVQYEPWGCSCNLPYLFLRYGTRHISGPTKAKHEYIAPARGTLLDVTKVRTKRKLRVVTSWQGGIVHLNIQLC